MSNDDNTPSSPSLPDNTLRAAYKLTLPVPAATKPSSGMNSAVICSATFTWRGVRLGVDCSNRAAPPLTIAAAMLVPLIM